jgi:transposase
MEDSKRASRRRHSRELKARVLDECAVAGVSIAQVALAYGLNANLIHKWRRQATGVSVVASPMRPADGFIPVTLMPNATQAAGEIGIELRRGATLVKVTWPLAAAVECAAWMRELLK